MIELPTSPTGTPIFISTVYAPATCGRFDFGFKDKRLYLGLFVNFYFSSIAICGHAVSAAATSIAPYNAPQLTLSRMLMPHTLVLIHRNSKTIYANL